MRDRTSDAHRTAASVYLGRPLRKGEVIHHRNEDKADNSRTNLEVTDRRTHTIGHNKARPVSKLRASLRMVCEGRKLY